MSEVRRTFVPLSEEERFDLRLAIADSIYARGPADDPLVPNLQKLDRLLDSIHDEDYLDEDFSKEEVSVMAYIMKGRIDAGHLGPSEIALLKDIHKKLSGGIVQ